MSNLEVPQWLYTYMIGHFHLGLPSYEYFFVKTRITNFTYAISCMNIVSKCLKSKGSTMSIDVHEIAFVSPVCRHTSFFVKIRIPNFTYAISCINIVSDCVKSSGSAMSIHCMPKNSCPILCILLNGSGILGHTVHPDTHLEKNWYKILDKMYLSFI